MKLCTFLSENPTRRSLHALKVVSKLEKICKPCHSGDMVWLYLKICDLWHTFHILATEWKETHMETIVTLIANSHQLQKAGAPEVLYWFSWVNSRLICLFGCFFLVYRYGLSFGSSYSVVNSLQHLQLSPDIEPFHDTANAPSEQFIILTREISQIIAPFQMGIVILT